MSKFDDAASEIYDNNKALIKMAKDRAFDLIAVGLIIIVGLLSLGAVELRKITLLGIINIIFEVVPFYSAAVILALNFYKKGVWSAKSTDGFISTVKTYSNKVNSLTGKQLDFIGKFCVDFNEKALIIMRENILRAAAIRYERYADVTYDRNGNELKPLSCLSKSSLYRVVGKRNGNIVMQANKAKVKGLNPSTLLGSDDNWDMTDLGKNEKELLRSQTKSYIVSFGFSAVLLTFMAVKNIMEWGWVGAVLALFKLIFIVCRCYMEYFKGYEDITIKVSNHISRKCDVLKQYDYWYYLRFPKEIDLTNPEYQWLSNISDNSLIYYNNEGCKTGDDGTSPKNVEGVLNE